MRVVERWFRDLPIARKLVTIGVVTSATTVLAACVAILAYDVASSYGRLAREVSLLADVVGSNSTAAIVFKDPVSANEILGAVAANEHIAFAAIRLPDRSLFATFHRAGRAHAPGRHDATLPAPDRGWRS